MTAIATSLEILDLRHFSAPALRPLLEEEAARWQQKLLWDYSRSIELLLDYITSRSLTGYVALRRGRVAGYAFGVCEATKAVVGDVYAFGESENAQNPVCEQLLSHLIETMQGTPGIERIESQLLLFADDALRRPFLGEGFRPFQRCFMLRDLTRRPPSSHPHREALPASYQIRRWQPEAYLPAAELIQEAYRGHTDADINDQYRSLAGARRFLHNIVNFPGCGHFDPAQSWLLLDARTGKMDGLVLCSRVRSDAAHITQLCLRTGLRGRSLGARLLEHCLAELERSGLRSVSLTVTDSNEHAMALYQHQGFEIRHRFEAWVWDKRQP